MKLIIYSEILLEFKNSCAKEISQRENEFHQSCIRKNLQKWFRYVIALPFKPKKIQLYHLIICSNYETGIRETKIDYSQRMWNKKS